MSGRHYEIAVEIEGRRYFGTWTLKQGGLICVAWNGGGAKTVELGRARPEVKAAKLLVEIVTKQQAQRAREQRALDAKRRQLSPNS